MQSARLVVATVVLVAFAGLVTTPAVADLISASTAYQKGDYAKAFRDFRELTELGQPTAHVTLALMNPLTLGVHDGEIKLSGRLRDFCHTATITESLAVVACRVIGLVGTAVG